MKEIWVKEKNSSGKDKDFESKRIGVKIQASFISFDSDFDQKILARLSKNILWKQKLTCDFSLFNPRFYNLLYNSQIILWSSKHAIIFKKNNSHYRCQQRHRIRHRRKIPLRAHSLWHHCHLKRHQPRWKSHYHSSRKTPQIFKHFGLSPTWCEWW